MKIVLLVVLVLLLLVTVWWAITVYLGWRAFVKTFVDLIRDAFFY